MGEVTVGGVKLGNGQPLVLIAGPCVIEGEKEALKAARKLKEICQKAGMPLIYKSSYDKANRSSGASFRGPGRERGLAILARVKEELGLSVLSDIHSEAEAEPAAEILDALQIPAFLCRQTDLLVAAAKTGKPLNVKKGPFLAPWDIKNVVEKIKGAGGRSILLTERGTTFGYNNLVADMRSLIFLREFGYPVIFDVTHSLQLPGGLGNASGGQRDFVPPLARAATAVGIDGLFIECHEDPDSAPSDGPSMLPMDRLPSLLEQVRRIHPLVGPR